MNCPEKGMVTQHSRGGLGPRLCESGDGSGTFVELDGARVLVLCPRPPPPMHCRPLPTTPCTAGLGTVTCRQRPP